MEMINKVHEHILDELRINAKSDTVFILSAIIINTATWLINTLFATIDDDYKLVRMFIIVAMTITICLASEIGLIKGRQASKKLLNGLIEMYKDNNLEKYYDATLLYHYKIRYNLFMIVIIAAGLISIITPFIGING
jgi:hypothetical protein